MRIEEKNPDTQSEQRHARSMARNAAVVVLCIALASVVLWRAARGADGMEGMDHGSMPGMGHDMTPVDTDTAPLMDIEAQGMQRLEPTIVNGVKTYRLDVGTVRWSILPDVAVGAMAYNGQVPGPLLALTAGDRVKIVVTNRLSEPTSVHWHGLQIPNDQDGAAGVTQRPIAPGQVYTYEFRVPNTPGTYFYHSHFAADRQQALGLAGPLTIGPKQPETAVAVDQVIMLAEWRVNGKSTVPAMEMEGALPNYFTINGKAYPSTERVKVRVGDRVRLRFIGAGQFIHPMHLHGQPFEIVATDGNPVPKSARLIKDTLLVGPGERYDVEFTVRAPGKWLLHCHINHHATNGGAEVDGGGGLTLVIEASA